MASFSQEESVNANQLGTNPKCLGASAPNRHSLGSGNVYIHWRCSYFRWQLMTTVDRSEVSRSLAKAIALQAVGKQEEAEEWARKLIRQLQLADILRDEV